VITITRDLKMQKYRERWKSILFKLNPDSVDPEEIPPDIIPGMAIMFNRLVEQFRSMKTQMPKTISRKTNGEIQPKERHNFISYNYVLRKELEMSGIYWFHDEFPIPRSHAKLHALDDIMEKMCKELDFPFQRSVVVKRPKLKRNP